MLCRRSFLGTLGTMMPWVVAAMSSAACGVGYEEKALEGGEGHNDSRHGTQSAQSTHQGEMVLTASSTTEWVYWLLDGGSVVNPASPQSSADWDLALRRTQLATNGGSSGSGQGGARAMGTTDFQAVTQCPTEGYTADAWLPIPGPPGSGEYSGNAALAAWFHYDPATHAVSSKGEVYCLRSAIGDYGKITILNYASGSMTLRWLHFHEQ